MTYEVRTAEMWPDADPEMRATRDDDGVLRFEGYAAVFGRPSRPLRFPDLNRGRPFVEFFEAGSYTKTISEAPDVTLRYQHNMLSLPLARTKAGTMTLEVRDYGLHSSGTLPDSEWGRSVHTALGRRDIDGMSVRFQAIQDNARAGEFPTEVMPDGSRIAVRRIYEARLGPEISFTDIPAYPDTTAVVRMLADEAGVDPDDLADAFGALREPDGRLSPAQRDLIVSIVNAHTDAPVMDAADVHKLALMRERMARLAG